jgi:thiol-disulfide isomerase/thioredoxin
MVCSTWDYQYYLVVPNRWLNRCGPCHAIAPKFESLAKEYTNVTFLKCDVDAAADVAKVSSQSGSLEN